MRSKWTTSGDVVNQSSNNDAEAADDYDDYDDYDDDDDNFRFFRRTVTPKGD